MPETCRWPVWHHYRSLPRPRLLSILTIANIGTDDNAVPGHGPSKIRPLKGCLQGRSDATGSNLDGTGWGAWDDPVGIVQPAVVDGLRVLAEVGLTYDVVSVIPRHLAHVATVAKAVPDLTLVIDHLSKPPIASGDLTEWRQLFAAAAEYPNVSAKVSGLDTAGIPETWTVDDLRPPFDHALETLGSDRLMYGGDWPISIVGGGYARQHAAFAALIAELSRDEQQAIKSGTAIRVYGLGGRSTSVSTGTDL